MWRNNKDNDNNNNKNVHTFIMNKKQHTTELLPLVHVRSKPVNACIRLGLKVFIGFSFLCLSFSVNIKPTERKKERERKRENINISAHTCYST